MTHESTLLMVEDADAELLTAAAQSRRRVEDLQRDLDATPWFQWGNRRWLHSLGREARADLRANTEALSGCDWDAFAGRLIDRQLISLHQESSSRHHRYHPEVLQHTDELAAEAARRLQAARLQSSFFERDVRPQLVDIDKVAPWLTVNAVRRHIRLAVERFQVIASDPEFLHEWIPWNGSSGHATRALVVQHRASGLRARFHPALTGAFGTVYSKPYKIGSIDSDAPGTMDDWQTYVGLGIGRHLYQFGADLIPDQRWALSGVTTDAAHAVRRRLHVQEPYRWQASCPWCEQHQIEWGSAGASAFAGHL